MKSSALSVLVLVSFAACIPKRDLTPAQIEKLDSLEKVMDVQATIADPQFKKTEQTSYVDADWTAFADLGERIQVTSKKAKEFTKGPEFDAFADRLGASAAALSTASAAKDAGAASKALGEMTSTCKRCHSKFK